MKQLGLNVKPRTLADDLLLTTYGPRCLSTFALAYNRTTEHLSHLGGRLAPKKSSIFASCLNHADWLKVYVWPAIGTTINVVRTLRDLGAQITIGHNRTTWLSRDRLTKATASVIRIGNLPHSKTQKERFVIACGHSQGLYGCESANVERSKPC